MRRIILSLFLTSGILSAHADEGMWMLTDLKQQNEVAMTELGLLIPAEQIYNPNSIALKDAVVHFGGGCTGEVISAEGLVLTNHHCGYGAIQQHSSVEHDYLTDGFWAMSRSEELPCKGLTVTYIDEIMDVTDYVSDQLQIDSDPNGTNYLSPKYLAMIADRFLSAQGITLTSGRKAELKAFYGGNKYYLFLKTTYSDIRMVGAPPSSIGKFGADTDNWMWPRHTGDFSMFRIYADANGEPAEYSESNVPLKTPKFLPISIKGLNEGDYAMIMGFPGSTERYLTQSEVKQRMNAVNQAMIDMRGVRLEVLRKYMDASDKTRIQYASKFAGSSNYWKNSIGMNKAIIDNDVLSAKAEIEKKYAAFAQGKPEYEGVVEKIDAIIEKSTPTLRQLYYTNEALRGAIEFGSTYLIMDNIKKALEEKNDSLLQASKKQLENAYDGIHNKDYDHEVDRAVAKAILPALAKALNANELPSFYQTINGEFKGDYDAYVDNIYDNSILSNRKNLDKFLAKPTVKAIEKDPATAYSRSKNEKLQELGKQYMELESGMELLHKAYIRGLGEMKQPVPSYPDANFTMRLTYGNVKSYSPRDAVHYDYYTTTDGILEKENPEDREFVVPAKLKELIQKKDFGRYAMADGTMPVCFLTTNDITGGNSGSPVINGEGQLIGTAFDGNWESLSGDINFNNDLQRCIALDIRYVLFILDKLGNCGHLINEMHIVE